MNPGSLVSLWKRKEVQVGKGKKPMANGKKVYLSVMVTFQDSHLRERGRHKNVTTGRDLFATATTTCSYNMTLACMVTVALLHPDIKR